ncbi:MAG: O-antigen ligase family protein [Flavobacteriaceae bacterium]
MFTNAKYVRLFAIIVHLVLGFLIVFQVVAMAYSYIILIIGFVMIVSSSNKNEEVAMWTAYLVGSEVFLRMTKGLFFYEMNKYAVIVFMLIGLFVEKRRHSVPPIYFLYLLLLLLGIVFTNVPFGVSLRRVIAFNLSGPFLLGIAALYFYKRTITREQLFRLLYYLLLPIFSMVAFMYFKTPDFKEINFGGVAIAETSGGFGPNQVATIIGFAIFAIAAFLFLKERLTGFRFIDIFILIYFTYRGFLTFSRGGMIAGGVAIVIFSVLLILGGRNKLVNLFKYTVIMSFMVLGIWLYTSDVTGGMIENRYAGKNARGVKKKDISAGRINIFQAQLAAFYSNPLVGVGVGGSKYFHENGIKSDTAHDEIGRLIAEHGLVGIFLLIILLTAPLPHILSQEYITRAFLVAFYLFWFLTINHSAMRVAFPGWIYGLSLIQLIDTEEEDYEETD